ncbi:hypothetical protein ADUPG1_006638 [Aduncisulcus paluster]|uniref:Uncharacterized protein n=1 Tax=Aduncisulcus paluster TaxID=2918883 RepID=A0ABQ5KJ01_9EUKA|nr:hypothetical protein ADUPG1_006638 [Aduncisulcus paluster]
MKTRSLIFVFFSIFALFFANAFCATTCPSCTDDEEYAALSQLYYLTEGWNWVNRENWLDCDLPLSDWYGITTSADGHVTEIVLPDNNLKGQFPFVISDLEFLKNVDLSSNDMVSLLPDSVCELVNLQYLDVKSNGLTGTIPSCICDMEYLKGLDLAQNDFSGPFPQCTIFSDNPLPELQTLSFACNLITKTDRFNLYTNLIHLETYNNLLPIPCEFIGDFPEGGYICESPCDEDNPTSCILPEACRGPHYCNGNDCPDCIIVDDCCYELKEHGGHEHHSHYDEYWKRIEHVGEVWVKDDSLEPSDFEMAMLATAHNKKLLKAYVRGKKNSLVQTKADWSFLDLSDVISGEDVMALLDALLEDVVEGETTEETISNLYDLAVSRGIDVSLWYTLDLPDYLTEIVEALKDEQCADGGPCRPIVSCAGPDCVTTPIPYCTGSDCFLCALCDLNDCPEPEDCPVCTCPEANVTVFQDHEECPDEFECSACPIPDSEDCTCSEEESTSCEVCEKCVPPPPCPPSTMCLDPKKYCRVPDDLREVHEHNLKKKYTNRHRKNKKHNRKEVRKEDKKNKNKHDSESCEETCSKSESCEETCSKSESCEEFDMSWRPSSDSGFDEKRRRGYERNRGNTRANSSRGSQSDSDDRHYGYEERGGWHADIDAEFEEEIDISGRGSFGDYDWDFDFQALIDMDLDIDIDYEEFYETAWRTANLYGEDIEDVIDDMLAELGVKDDLILQAVAELICCPTVGCAPIQTCPECPPCPGTDIPIIPNQTEVPFPEFPDPIEQPCVAPACPPCAQFFCPHCPKKSCPSCQKCPKYAMCPDEPSCEPLPLCSFSETKEEDKHCEDSWGDSCSCETSETSEASSSEECSVNCEKGSCPIVWQVLFDYEEDCQDYMLE